MSIKKKENMKYSEKSESFRNTAESLLKKHEGYSDKLYKCTAGKWTIGVGHNIEDNGMPDFILKLLFEHDASVIWDEMISRLPWVESSPDSVKIVLLDMAFNMGVPRLMNFKNMLRYAEASDWENMYKQMMDSRWARQVPNRAAELGRMILNLLR